ncbi:MAG: hypothetical protein ACOYKZ_07645 [Chlamydiia bacterium]
MSREAIISSQLAEVKKWVEKALSPDMIQTYRSQSQLVGARALIVQFGIQFEEAVLGPARAIDYSRYGNGPLGADLMNKSVLEVFHPFERHAEEETCGWVRGALVGLLAKVVVGLHRTRYCAALSGNWDCIESLRRRELEHTRAIQLSPSKGGTGLQRAVQDLFKTAQETLLVFAYTCDPDWVEQPSLRALYVDALRTAKIETAVQIVLHAAGENRARITPFLAKLSASQLRMSGLSSEQNAITEVVNTLFDMPEIQEMESDRLTLDNAFALLVLMKIVSEQTAVEIVEAEELAETELAQEAMVSLTG